MRYLDPRQVNPITLRRRKIVIALNVGAMFMTIATLIGHPLVAMAVLTVGSVGWLMIREWRDQSFDRLFF